jgi:hypothetical protein
MTRRNLFKSVGALLAASPLAVLAKSKPPMRVEPTAAVDQEPLMAVTQLEFLPDEKGSRYVLTGLILPYQWRIGNTCGLTIAGKDRRFECVGLGGFCDKAGDDMKFKQTLRELHPDMWATVNPFHWSHPWETVK